MSNININDKELQNLDKISLSCATSERLGFLTGKKYSINDLQYIVENCNVELTVILKTQYLTADFCMKYILNNNYCISEMDKYITEGDILYYQPHLTLEELNQYKNKI